MATVCALRQGLTRSFLRSAVVTATNRHSQDRQLQTSHYSTLALSANTSYDAPGIISDIHDGRQPVANPYGLSNPNMLYTTKMPPICGHLYQQWRDAGRRRYADAPI